jgi:myo-inositol-1(or 4)-monophosphatase
MRFIVRQSSILAKSVFKIYKKGDDDIVTEADKKIEKYLIKKLYTKYPKFDIVSEEYNSKKELTENCFIIDPIDGTKNFASGLPLWGIQMACVKNGEVVSSVLYFPKLKEMYYADADGAYCNFKKLDLAAMHHNKANKPIYDIEGGNKFPALIRMEEEVHRNFRYIACSSLGYAWVANGNLGGFMLRKNEKWDTVPGLYLVKQAGGFTIDKPDAHFAATTEKMCDDLYAHGRF